MPPTKPRVYIETTVVSYLAARPSRDIVTLAHQQITQEWWRSAARRFDLVASDVVRDVAADGDPGAARTRLRKLAHVAGLNLSAEASALAEELLDAGALPRPATQDAVHIAIAVTNSVDYFATWNLRHIANAVARTAIERTCRRAGYRPTVICTPEELLETDASRDDPIVAEVRAIRAKLAGKHGGTVEGLFKHLREVRRTSERTYVSYPPIRIEPEGQEARVVADDAKG